MHRKFLFTVTLVLVAVFFDFTRVKAQQPKVEEVTTPQGHHVSVYGVPSGKQIQATNPVEQLTDLYDKARTDLHSAGELIITALGNFRDDDVEARISTLLDQIEHTPRDFKLHVALCDALIVQIDRLVAANRSAMQGDIVQKRDKVVKVLEELSATIEERAKLSTAKAADAEGTFKDSYIKLASSEGRFARGYQTRADDYASVPLDANMKELQKNIEFLNHARGTLEIIKPALASIVPDTETIEGLVNMSFQLGQIQDAMERFSKAINNVWSDTQTLKPTTTSG